VRSTRAEPTVGSTRQSGPPQRATLARGLSTGEVGNTSGVSFDRPGETFTLTPDDDVERV
jgi:hypothetical protein